MASSVDLQALLEAASAERIGRQGDAAATTHLLIDRDTAHQERGRREDDRAHGGRGEHAGGHLRSQRLDDADGGLQHC